MPDFLIRGTLSEVDPDVYNLIEFEKERQFRKLILIPSESTAPQSVREALGSVFQNIYAEGYPDEESRKMSESEILDYNRQLSHFRRYSDPRYYKGVEYADVAEALARRRCAEVFATEKIPADRLYVNVQPLSGAPANNAVYQALINPGDTILGMNLLHGGHLTHGSSVNRSGKLYKVVHYNVDPITEQINYDSIMALAIENRPKVIIAGYSSYPWIPDWAKFREIADACGAVLFADVSHIAGLIAGKAVPSPVGFAHVITFTTHKTLCGPRGAVILTDDAALGRKFDRAVFPGEQGGPHVHVFAALATTFKIARTTSFSDLQHQIIKNCAVLTNQLASRGLRIPFGGTNSHLGNIDCKTIRSADGSTLSGDMAARILDLAGIVTNRNTIPGDKTALNASGVRYGTPWVTQRGLKEKDMLLLGDLMADVLLAAKPYTLDTRKGEAPRAKIDFGVLETTRLKIREMAENAGIDEPVNSSEYPHFYYIDSSPKSTTSTVSLRLSGKNVRHFCNYIFSSDISCLIPGKSQSTTLSIKGHSINATLTQVEAGEFRVTVDHADYGKVSAWMRDLSDGFVQFDQDVLRRIPGPVFVEESDLPKLDSFVKPSAIEKPFYIGKQTSSNASSLPIFSWAQTQSELQLHRTVLYETHKKLGAKMVPFAGWEMPVWYTSVSEEHLATRKTAGLFDVSHMGVFQVEGIDACTFLDSVCGNDIAALEPGESCYTHFLDPDANVIDDTLVYRRSQDKYLVVVNASNDDKDWIWLNAVKDGKVLVDRKFPGARAFGYTANLRNLRSTSEGKDMRVDIALQGPKSRDILLALGCSTTDRAKIMGLKRTELCEANLANLELIVSRTGYTGEKMAFELFVHPDQAVTLCNLLLEKGNPLGLKPCGLAARDSLRTEAGLPLYGHEMGGDAALGVGESGFGSYVKTYKPWFIGRDAYIERERNRSGEIVRFRFLDKAVRMAHLGDPVIDKKGKVIGFVTSCSVDSEGMLTGQAFLDLASCDENTPISIYQGSPKSTGKAPYELKPGDKITLPTSAIVISRFPK